MKTIIVKMDVIEKVRKKYETRMEVTDEQYATLESGDGGELWEMILDNSQNDAKEIFYQEEYDNHREAVEVWREDGTKMNNVGYGTIR